MASEATGSTFDSCISLLEYVDEAWEKNKEIQVANGQHNVIIVVITIDRMVCITDTPSYSSNHEGGDSPSDDSDDGNDGRELQSELRHLLSEQQKESEYDEGRGGIPCSFVSAFSKKLQRVHSLFLVMTKSGLSYINSTMLYY